MLLYDGDGPTAGIVGLSYYIMKDGDDEPTEGFTGDNDHYHRHVGPVLPRRRGGRRLEHQRGGLRGHRRTQVRRQPRAG